MPNFPAASIGTMVVGIDIHTGIGNPVHPYFGCLFMWHSPQFPKANVFVNKTPACAVGAMGYSAHIPTIIPLPPTPMNALYWKRYLLNVPMALTLVALTMVANSAIAGIASVMSISDDAKKFIQDSTGIDMSSRKKTWESVKANLSAFTQWSTWVQLLLPPLPFPGAQGSTTVGAPRVKVNGGPMAFVAPLVAGSCSDIPVVPNAMTLGFSNVLVGFGLYDLAVVLTQRAVTAAAGAGANKLKNRIANRKNRKQGKKGSG